jgi:uncharacterized protein
MKPGPRVTGETAPFWEACGRGELTYQQCLSCDAIQFPPRNHCVLCLGDALAWRRSAGRGTVHSFTVVQRAPSAAFREDVPYVLALVDLDEGFRMMMNVLGCAPGDVTIGARVTITFETREDGSSLPQAELIAGS